MAVPSGPVMIRCQRAPGPAAMAAARSRQAAASRCPYPATSPGCPVRPSQVARGTVRLIVPVSPAPDPGPAAGGQPGPGPGPEPGPARTAARSGAVTVTRTVAVTGAVTVTRAVTVTWALAVTGVATRAVCAGPVVVRAAVLTGRVTVLASAEVLAVAAGVLVARAFVAGVRGGEQGVQGLAVEPGEEHRGAQLRQRPGCRRRP